MHQQGVDRKHTLSAVLYFGIYRSYISVFIVYLQGVDLWHTLSASDPLYEPESGVCMCQKRHKIEAKETLLA
jgi:hypothetical protein